MENSISDLMAKVKSQQAATAAPNKATSNYLPQSAPEGEEITAIPVWDGMQLKVTLHPDGRRANVEVQFYAPDLAKLLQHLVDAGMEVREWRDVPKWQGAKETTVAAAPKHADSNVINSILNIGRKQEK